MECCQQEVAPEHEQACSQANEKLPFIFGPKQLDFVEISQRPPPQEP